METRWWAIAYMNQAGKAGTLDIQIETAEPYPVTPQFWDSVVALVRDRQDGVLMAITPVSAPFGCVIGGTSVNKRY